MVQYASVTESGTYDDYHCPSSIVYATTAIGSTQEMPVFKPIRGLRGLGTVRTALPYYQWGQIATRELVLRSTVLRCGLEFRC